MNKSSLLKVCKCGHPLEEHDWGLGARRAKKADCLVVGCSCDNFVEAEQKDKEPRPPHCVCCEYMRVCDKDRTNGQKIDYCPDENYRTWLLSGQVREKGKCSS